MIDAKGKGAFLLKGGSKKKRSRAEMEEVKGKEALLESDKQQFLREFKKLKQDQNHIGEEMQQYRAQEEILNRLH